MRQDTKLNLIRALAFSLGHLSLSRRLFHTGVKREVIYESERCISRKKRSAMLFVCFAQLVCNQMSHRAARRVMPVSCAA